MKALSAAVLSLALCAPQAARANYAYSFQSMIGARQINLTFAVADAAIANGHIGVTESAPFANQSFLTTSGDFANFVSLSFDITGEPPGVFTRTSAFLSMFLSASFTPSGLLTNVQIRSNTDTADIVLDNLTGSIGTDQTDFCFSARCAFTGTFTGSAIPEPPVLPLMAGLALAWTLRRRRGDGHD